MFFLAADARRPALRYVPSMVGFRAVVRAIRGHPVAGDAVLAGALAVFVLQDIFTNSHYLTGPKSIYIPAGLVMTIPLAWRRAAPLIVVSLVMTALAVQSLLLDPSDPYPDSEIVPLIVAAYSVAAHSVIRTAAVGGLVSLAAGIVWVGIDDFLLPLVAFGGAWFAGRLVQQRQLYAEAYAERARVLERERDVNARVAAAEERVRLARELHDVVGHSVSVMVVQAGAERLALGEERPSTREALLAIERTGREALAEMSRLLGMLRTSDERLSLAPRPSLADLEGLVATVREAGVRVELRVEGEQLALAPGVDVSAYRIVQEALTNVVKHAGPVNAWVVVRYLDGALELEVSDDGPAPVNDGAPGYGLAGMRERVELHGGALEAGARNGGGFAVKARLPAETVTR
jgi:signal transduction histidine kinase